jgi:hypothetical protein
MRPAGLSEVGGAGGITYVGDRGRYVAGRAGPRQIVGCSTMLISGSAGIMCDQAAFVLREDAV